MPLLSDDEFDAQYRRVYERARAKGDASAEVNLVRGSLMRGCLPCLQELRVKGFGTPALMPKLICGSNTWPLALPCRYLCAG